MLDEGDDPILEALWERAVAAPAADEPNRAFVEHCRRTGRLPIAGRRYREALAAADGEQRALLESRLGAVTAAALAELDLRRAEVTPPRRPVWITVAAALVLGVALYGLAAAFAAR